MLSSISGLCKVLTVSVFVLIFVLFSFRRQENYTSLGWVDSATYELNSAIQTLDETATGYKLGRIQIDSLQHQLTRTRLLYKKIEFYLASQYPEYSKEHLNGAPLLHIEKEGTRPKVVEPEGLQVLDELIFADEAFNERSRIAAVAKKLANSYGVLIKGIKNDNPAKSGISALRLQLIRIFTLGITGFDTPGSANAIEEARVSLSGMQEFYKEYYSGHADSKKINDLFKGAIAELGQPVSFEAFDRLHFFTAYIDPLYKELGKQEHESNNKSLVHSSAWNTGSESIFADNFLNPYFFSELTQREDSEALRQLGRQLFYDTGISNNNKVSCASCHQPDRAFTDGIPKSLSNVQGKTVLRNAPTLVNAVYADRFFYDLRAFTLEQQAEHVIFNPDEFNTAYSAILKKLENKQEYAQKFKKVFGKKGITRETFSKALASYVLSLRSFNSEFDKYVRGEAKEIDDNVKKGFNLFMGKANCATCHFAPTFSGLVPPLYSENETEILGVLSDPEMKNSPVDTDSGRYTNEVYSEYSWIYEKSFKTTTVRNAALTAPYFHNGAYKTLEEVIDFYDNGGGAGIGHAIKNQTLPADKLQLSDTEKESLIAFIKSLNDVPSR